MKTKFIFLLIFFSCISGISFSQPLSLMNINSWAYQLQNININQIANDTTFELIVIDYSIDGTDVGKFTPQEIAQIKNSGKKVIAYISIGEAENYRFYWQNNWNTNPPAWLGPENPDWPGNYKVKYWYTEWQNIIFNYIDTIISQGFDGIYMDIIDAYYYWQEENSQQPLADSLMIQFVLNIRNHVNSVTTNPFYMIPQNGEDVINSTNVSQSLKASYLNAINAVGVEDVFFRGSLDENNPYNPDNYRIQQLEEYKANGKRIFSIEYLTQQNKIQQYLTAAQNQNYVPYACVRPLNQLCNQIQIRIEDEMLENKIYVYPNPFSTTTTLEIIDFNLQNCSYDVNIFDLMGKIVFKTEIKNQKSLTLNLNLPDGIYLLQLRGNDFLYSQKLQVIIKMKAEL